MYIIMLAKEAGKISIDWLIDWLIDKLIDWFGFYADSAIFQPCNGGNLDKYTQSIMLNVEKLTFN